MGAGGDVVASGDIPAGWIIRYVVVVVYHAIFVTIGHGLLKKSWPMVIGCVLRTAGNAIS